MHQITELGQRSNSRSDLTQQISPNTELMCGGMDERCWVELVGVIAGVGALAGSETGTPPINSRCASIANGLR